MLALLVLGDLGLISVHPGSMGGGGEAEDITFTFCSVQLGVLHIYIITVAFLRNMNRDKKLQ